MSRTTITAQNYGNQVTLKYTDLITDEARERLFVLRGGYVYELLGMRGNAYQSSSRLYNSGTTLTVPEGQAMIDVIRREYKALRREQQRELAAQ